MKAIIYAFITMAVFFTIFYLMGCFIQNSFNIGNWTDAARGVVGSFGGSLSIVFGIAVGKSVDDQLHNNKP